MPWKYTDGTPLGIFAPLLGTWVAQSDSPKGQVLCTRTFSKILNGHFIEVRADWQFPHNRYQELALIGLDENRFVTFSTFDSDGQRSAGRLIKPKERHVRAFGFEMEMSHVFTRQVYWPHQETGFQWTVEIHTGGDWQCLVKHHYKPFSL